MVVGPTPGLDEFPETVEIEIGSFSEQPLLVEVVTVPRAVGFGTRERDRNPLPRKRASPVQRLGAEARYRSTAAAARRPLSMARTMSEAPNTVSPQAKTPGAEVSMEDFFVTM